MKKLLYIVVSILGIGAILGGCAGSGNNQSNTVVAEASDDAPWFVGCWSSDDGSLLYIDDEIEDRGTNGKMGHLYFEFTMDRPYEPNSDYRKCGYIYDKYNDSWVFETYVDVDGDLMEADYFRGNEEAKTIYGECNRKEIVFHKDPSAAERIGEKIGKSIEQQRIAQATKPKKEKVKIPSGYKWLFGTWSSDDGSIIIKKPNKIYLNESYGWLEFGFDGEKLHAYLAQDWIEFTVDTFFQVITDESGKTYVKEDRKAKKAAQKGSKGKASSERNTNSSNSSSNSDKYKVVGEWVFRHGKTGDLNYRQEYEEGVRFDANMTGVYNSFVATYRGLDMTNRKRTGSFTFTWDIVGDDVYITVNGERSHEYTYSMYGTLTDSGGNVFKRQ